MELNLNYYARGVASAVGMTMSAIAAVASQSTGVLLGGYNGLIVTNVALLLFKNMPAKYSSAALPASMTAGLLFAVPITFFSAKLLGIKVVFGKLILLNTICGLATLALTIVICVAKFLFPDFANQGL